MKELLNILNIEFLKKVLKNLLIIIPVCIITNNLYIHFFNEYKINWSFQDAINFTIKNPEKLTFTIVVFSLIFFSTLFFKNFVFPTAALWLGKVKLNDTRKFKININKFLKKTIGVNVYSYISKDQAVVYEIYQYFMYFPICLILWLLCINSLIAYISIGVVLYLTIVVFRGVNTAITEHRK